MSEYVNTYSLDQQHRMLYPVDRKTYYEKILDAHKNGEEPHRSVEVIQVLLFNGEGDLIVQKRAAHKKQNANLLDKSVGGHIRVGDTPDHTVILETVQELEIPSFVVHGRDEFLNKLDVLNEYLHTVGLIQYIDCHTHMFYQIFDGEAVKVPKKYHLYFGVYNGSTRTVDKEAKGILRYDMKELRAELTKYPDLYTNDFRYFIDTYGDQIDRFVQDIRRR